MGHMTVGIDEIRAAQDRIAPYVVRTPTVPATALALHCGGAVTYKLETLQHTGSFKLRGATNALLTLIERGGSSGVAAVSTGNHGRAVAAAARRLNLRAVICVSRLVPAVKTQAIRDLGAEVFDDSATFDDAASQAAAVAQQDGLTLIDPFDDRDVVAGQGTLGLEIMADAGAAAPRTLIVPLSGGGLIGGVGVAAKHVAPDVRLIGVCMERGPAMVMSQQAGHPVYVVEEPTLADSLSGGIGLDNKLTFNLVRDLVDDMVLVSEEEIAAAMAFACRAEGLVVEGGAAVGIAALLSGRVSLDGGPACVVLSGRNVAPERLAAILLQTDA